MTKIWMLLIQARLKEVQIVDRLFCACVLGLDFGPFHFLCLLTLSTRSNFLLNTHFSPSIWILDRLVACFQAEVDNVCIWNAWRRWSQWINPALVHFLCLFLLLLLLFFVCCCDVHRVYCKALTLIRKKRITCHEQKWPCVCCSICELSST